MRRVSLREWQRRRAVRGSTPIKSSAELERAPTDELRRAEWVEWRDGQESNDNDDGADADRVADTGDGSRTVAATAFSSEMDSEDSNGTAEIGADTTLWPPMRAMGLTLMMKTRDFCRAVQGRARHVSKLVECEPWRASTCTRRVWVTLLVSGT